MLVFSATILRGMLAGNATELILQKSLVGLFGGTVLGMVLGAIAMVVISDNLQTAGADASLETEDPSDERARPDGAGGSMKKTDNGRNGSNPRPRTT